VETFGDTGKDSDSSQLEALVMLLRQGKAYGLHFIISASRLNELSNKLYSLFTERLTLRLSESGDYRAIVGPGVGEVDEIPGRGFVKVGRQPLEFQVAIPMGEFDEQGQPQNEAKQIRALGAMMEKGEWDGREPLRIDALPKTSSFRQVLTEIHSINPDRFLDELKDATARTWELNGSAAEADWLKAVLGITSGNRKRELQLEAKKDGVHGLIAGGTGSGKSELLMTMIVGLALNFPPDVLNFVLVDYKGGGAFKPFETLPHCVDIVTNLNKAAVNRMFAAINAEMRRRQKMNADTGTKDIVEYRKKNLHRTIEPYPHLFIIIDEYAEMIDDNPEYRMELESITRVGRAQGVNLILASQRPKGVTDQMRANIKLRICLRVEQLDTSRELLRRPDAALLPSGMPGRGYLQVGNENLELIQVSWTGEDQPDDREAAVLWPDRPKSADDVDDDETPKVFDAAVQLTSELVDHKMAPKPWPSFLPFFFSLQSPIDDAQKGERFTLTTAVSDWLNDDTDHLWPGVNWRENALRPIAGLVDDPAEAKQYPLKLELHRTHLAIFGDSGWGKTSFLRTVIVSLAASHSPSEFQAYVLDLGGRNFRSIEHLPHVGAVIYADEETFEERLQRLLDKLNRMTEERQQIISNADANNLLEFNEKRPNEAMPGIVVAIDNFAELRENYEGLVEGTIMPLVRRSLSVGITFVVTGNIPTNMPSKLYNLFGERITFKQANKDRYMDIVGRGAIEIDDIAGRGYIRIGRRPLLLHAALPVGIPDQETGRDALNEADEIRLMARMMKEKIKAAGPDTYQKPGPIDTLQEKIPLIDLLETAKEAKPNRIQGILGENSSLQTAYFNLRRMGPHFAVVGPPLSGKTTALYNWVFSLTDRYSPKHVQIVLIDLQRRFVEYGGERTLADLPHVLMTIDEGEQMAALVQNLKNECPILAEQEENREIFVIIDNYDDLSEEIERDRDVPRDLSVLSRRYGRDGLHFIIAGTLDSNNELRRRVQQSNYGVGLRSASAVDTLRVIRRPAALRGKELNVGRGFIVKSGQPTLMQVASPYDGMGVELPAGADIEEEEERNAKTLDLWVERICNKHPDTQAEWSAPGAVAATGAAGGAPVQSKEATRMFTVLQKAMQYELANYEGENGTDELVTMQLLQMDMQNWGNEEALLDLVKQVWRKTTSLSDDMADMMIDTYDTESLLMEIEQVVGNGANGAEGA
jgi:S-DNA-T family DNA segregation ATPase FtsK/SpoIIIE